MGVTSQDKDKKNIDLSNSQLNSLTEVNNKSVRTCETLPMSSSNDDSDETMSPSCKNEKNKKDIKEEIPNISAGNVNEGKPAPQAKPNTQKSEDVIVMMTTSKPQQTTEQGFDRGQIEKDIKKREGDTSEVLDYSKLKDISVSREKEFAKEIRKLSKKNALDSIARAEVELKLTSMERDFEQTKKDLFSSRNELLELKKHLLGNGSDDVANLDHRSDLKPSIQKVNEEKTKFNMIIDNQEDKSSPSSQFFTTHARSRNRNRHILSHRGRSSSPTIFERIGYESEIKSEKIKRLLNDSSDVDNNHSTNFMKAVKVESNMKNRSPKVVKEVKDHPIQIFTSVTKDLHDKIENNFDVEATLKNCNSEVVAKEYRYLVRKTILQKEYNAQLLAKILSLQGNIQVCCRVRPMLDAESFAGQKIVTEVLSETEVSCYDRRNQSWKSYGFDKVWGPDATQQEVFCDIQPLALSVVDGYNACIFAYGQTGSGKTYTMEGSIERGQLGISHRTIKKIFTLLEFRSQQHAASTKIHSREGDDYSTSKFMYTLKVGMMEIYNDEVYDLLLPPMRRNSFMKRPTLDIRRSKKGTIEVPDLDRQEVTSLDDVVRIFKRASDNRATASTNLNEHSSRSHMILNVEVVSGVEGNQNRGKLYLVDLAGSERVHKSAVEGKRLKETSYINKSLAALGNVMKALDTKSSHVPYRDSKLTYLLKDCFHGNSRTMMIVAACPGSGSYDETQCALKFATRVKKVHLGISQRNVVSGINLGKTVRKLTAELMFMTEAKHQTEQYLRNSNRECQKLKKRLDRYMSKGSVSKKDSSIAMESDSAFLILKGIEDCKNELTRVQNQLQRGQEQNKERSIKDFQIYNNNTMEEELHEFQKHVASASPKPKVIRDPDKIRQTVMDILEKNDPEHVDKINDIMARFSGKEAILLEKTINRYKITKLEDEIPEITIPAIVAEEKFDLKTPSKSAKKENKSQLAYTPFSKRSELAEKKHRNRLEVARSAMRQ